LEDLSFHILDIVENGIEAGATSINIFIEEDIKEDILTMTVEDNGQGMEGYLIKNAFDPFVTTRKTRRVGLGLPLLYESARIAGGDVRIESEPGRGTKVTATFQHSHIDRKPLGNIAQTLLTLIAGNPQIEFRYEHKRDGQSFVLDTSMIKKELGDIPINNPEVIRFIKEYIDEGLKGLQGS
jgi:hypothetical protein